MGRDPQTVVPYSSESPHGEGCSILPIATKDMLPPGEETPKVSYQHGIMVPNKVKKKSTFLPIALNRKEQAKTFHRRKEQARSERRRNEVTE